MYNTLLKSAKGLVTVLFFMGCTSYAQLVMPTGKTSVWPLLNPQTEFNYKVGLIMPSEFSSLSWKLDPLEIEKAQAAHPGKWVVVGGMNGSVLFACDTANKALNGTGTFYDDAGNVTTTAEYKMSTVPDGKVVHYYPGGKIAVSLEARKGLLWNIFEMNDESGKPLPNPEFKNGSGTLIQYYSNGAVCARIGMSEGKMNGEVESVWPGGLPREKYSMVMGVLHGEYTSWSDSGDMLHKGPYRNGKMNGKWEIYESGKLKQYEFYLDGKLTGTKPATQ